MVEGDGRGAGVGFPVLAALWWEEPSSTECRLGPGVSASDLASIVPHSFLAAHLAVELSKKSDHPASCLSILTPLLLKQYELQSASVRLVHIYFFQEGRVTRRLYTVDVAKYKT